MKIKLGIKERIVLMMPGFLVPGSNIVEQLLIRGLLETVVITPAEISKLKIKEGEDGITRWDVKKEEKEKNFEIELTDEQVEMLKKSVQILEQNDGVTQDNLDFCIRINNLTV